ncbi:MAG TPA: pilus assembly protein TadG-related protein [Acidimicrobiia bacterium]|nr:pilus assembly protein TadG-related protein [Acidimicrobiia bacterium]
MTDDDGASMVLVAVSMVVLLAFIGLVIDVGRIYDERRQLSRGADAAVLAIAADCATFAKPCDEPTAMATADSYADANAGDGAAAIHTLELDVGERRVFVRTKTIDADTGNDQLDTFFAWIVGFDSLTVYATAEAIWDYPTGGAALPLIISVCEYNRWVDPVTGPDEDLDVVIYFHDGNSTEDCNAQAGQDTDGDGILSGGFGWVATNGDCSAEVYDGNWVAEDPGASASTGCSADELYNLVYDKTVIIPYFDDTQGLGANGEYHIAGLGAFHVTGYNFGGQYRAPSSTLAPCSGDERCISGFFTTDEIDEGQIGGQDFGVVIVKLVG